ncbi:hypothetical protein Ae201684_001608 [Aphanomyces euteiches]|uniref:Uncharacterized protein n=1 Tax=Aphanomyces euteiches TaxID=100861 RepID=A0A6G0XTV0_9STRA|nr:hypothetical protein Ae201684_001608 [Aphanomyces euteiches]
MVHPIVRRLTFLARYTMLKETRFMNTAGFTAGEGDLYVKSGLVETTICCLDMASHRENHRSSRNQYASCVTTDATSITRLKQQSLAFWH